MSTINLEHGEPDPDDESPSARRRRERRTSDSSKSGSGSGTSGSSGTSRATERENASLATRISTALDKIADQMALRDDDELATAIREERGAMSHGLVSLTDQITPLRVVLVLVMALAEPILAFYRVGRILFFRFLVWRENRIAARKEAVEQWQREQEAQGIHSVT